MYQTSPFSFYIHIRSAPIITSITLTKPYFQVNEQCTDFLVARHLALYTWYLGNSASPDGGQGRAMGWVYLLQLIHSPELHDSMECFIFLSIIIWGFLARTDRYISHSRTTRQNSAWPVFTLFYLMGSLKVLCWWHISDRFLVQLWGFHFLKYPRRQTGCIYIIPCYSCPSIDG